MLFCMMISFNLISSYQTSHLCKNEVNKKFNIPFLTIFVFAIVFGIRYNVGIDHIRYIERYEELRLFGTDSSDPELGFLMIGKFFASLDLHYSFYFFFLAFLQLFLIFYALRYNYKVLGWVIVTFMLSTTFLNFMNGIRQQLAFCIQTVALLYLSRKKIVKCYLYLCLAILFHTSAILLLPLPLFYLRKNNYFNNVSIQIKLFFVFLIGSAVFKPVVPIFLSIMDILEVFGYQGYKYMVLGGDLSFLTPKRTAGLGFILLIILNLINITQSNKVKAYHNSLYLNLLYDFYFVGVLYNYLVSGSLIFERINFYFYNFSFIISAFTLYYFTKNRTKKNQYLKIMMILIYLLLFYAIVVFRGEESCAIYNTCFQ